MFFHYRCRLVNRMRGNHQAGPQSRIGIAVHVIMHEPVRPVRRPLAHVRCRPQVREVRPQASRHHGWLPYHRHRNIGRPRRAGAEGAGMPCHYGSRVGDRNRLRAPRLAGRPILRLHAGCDVRGMRVLPLPQAARRPPRIRCNQRGPYPDGQGHLRHVCQRRPIDRDARAERGVPSTSARTPAWNTTGASSSASSPRLRREGAHASPSMRAKDTWRDGTRATWPICSPPTHSSAHPHGWT